jgi:hypothetical protein
LIKSKDKEAIFEKVMNMILNYFQQRSVETNTVAGFRRQSESKASASEQLRRISIVSQTLLNDMRNNNKRPSVEEQKLTNELKN